MKLYPETLNEFTGMFSDESGCIAYLRKIKWPKGYACPRCFEAEYWEKTNGLLVCKSCRHETSITAGTLFDGSRKSLKLWFQAMWYVVGQKNGVSALGLQKALGLGSYQTAWNWLHKMRRAMVCDRKDKLSGVVEVDETWVGGARNRHDERDAKSLIFIAIQLTDNGLGRVRLEAIKTNDQSNLLCATKKLISPNSTIRSDGLHGYNILSHHGYKHEPTVHNNAIFGDATPNAHRVASLLKRWWLGTHQGAISPKYLPYYLDEFTFRFNRRTSNSRGKLFYRLMQGAVEIYPIRSKDLKHNI